MRLSVTGIPSILAPMFHRRHALAAVLALTLGLAACGGDDSGNSSSGGSTPQPPPSVTPPPTPTPTNRAPTISGTPSSTVKTSAAYYFQPSASDADGDALTFSVAGKPSWAQFNSSTGALYGTPGDGTSGAYSGIQISVSDGKAQATLPAFTITVSPPVIGSATLSWQAPVKNEDGSALTDLAGYVVRYSKNPGNLDQTISISSPSATTAVIQNLVEGTWFFTLSSVNSSGVESRPTGTVSKVIG